MSEDPEKPASRHRRTLRLLIAGDDLARLGVYLGAVAQSKIAFQPRIALSQRDFVSELRESGADVVLSDDRVDGWTATDALSLIHDISPGVPLIIVSDTRSDDLAAKYWERGITDCLSRDDLSRLPIALCRAHREISMREAQLRAFDALRESEARYRRLLDHVTCGIAAVSRDGKILNANRALARMLGYLSPDELLAAGNTMLVYCESRSWEDITAKNESAAGPNGTGSPAAKWKRKDGRAFDVQITSWRAPDPQREDGCVEMMVEDVTERVGLEKQLIQSQKFEAIGQLAGGIAHDFSNLIGAIRGWAELGVEETEPGSRLHRHFEKVCHQADRAAALTRRLLAFARPRVVEPSKIDLNQAVIETLSLLDKVLGANIRITANLSPYLAVVRADPIEIEQVLMNFCLNARDAMPEGGSLIVETANVFLSEEQCASRPLAHPGAYAVISVEDTGTGMDATTLEHIFEPFFTTKEAGKGTGLGLATVYDIVRQHDGFVQAESELGAGTTIRAYFPASTPAERNNAPALATVRALASPKRAS